MRVNKQPPLYPLLFSALLLCSNGCGPLPKQPASPPIISAEESAKRYRLDSEWWHRYGSPSLDKTVSLALERNLDLAKAAILVNRACYEAKLIGADLIPTFASETSISASKDLSGKTGTIHQYGSSLTLNYELDLWKRLRHATSAAQWETLATSSDLESTRLALINTVVDTWFNLRYLEKAIGIVERYAARYQKLAEITAVKYTLGKVDSVEPLQAEQSFLAAKNTLFALQAEKSDTEARLRTLLNLRPNEPLPQQSGDIMAFSSLPVALEVPIAALSARPDIRAAEQRVKSSFRSLEAQRAEWLPRLSIGSALRTDGGKRTEWFDAPFLSGLVSFTLPFLDWNRLRWELKISEKDFELSKIALQQAVTSALNEVDTSYTAWEKKRDTVKNFKERCKKSEKIAQYYEARYDAGAAELKDYLEALNNADSDTLSLLENFYLQLSYENAVYKAMGGRYLPK